MSAASPWRTWTPPPPRCAACSTTSARSDDQEVARVRQGDTFTGVQISGAIDSAVLVDADEAGHLAELFRLLGDPTRVRILYALLAAGELCVHDVATTVEASETKVSQALRLLRTAGAVRNRRDGRHIYYRLDDDHIRQLLAVCRDHLAHAADDR